ncbi:MAG TPA: HD-GYP domain-containing protein [Solirubrobacteraceae bacterium]|jgi:putative nucleotidyltransferase with HDIG domain|nr:HD-GYP domain-containing protein [Solirubrobacteraceae bacterium]
MSFEPSFDEQELLAESLKRDSSRMSARERVAGALIGAAFAAAVIALWTVHPPTGFAAGPALLGLMVLLVANFVRFDTPFGCTRATQLGFVPLLFAIPLATVPLAVALALALTWLPDIRSGELRPSRLLQIPCNAWFAIGPVAVLVLANVEPRDAGPLLLIAALAAQFLADFIVSSVRFVILRGASFSSVVRSTWVYGIDAALSGIAVVVAEDIHTAPIAALTVVPLLGLLAVFAHERHQRLESMLELSSAYRGTALVLGDVIEADDGYTGEHCKSVVSLALEVAEHLGLSPERQRNLEFAALLHDVGKIAIPKEIINKPGKLDPHEWTIIKTHTVEGQKMLERVGGFMRQVGLIVRSHHERWDGGGYPDGLAGEAIPLEARIIACCDTWNAMRTDRPYRNALSHNVAVAELVANAGGQFDPLVVDTFVRLVAPADRPEAVQAGATAAVRAPAPVIAGPIEI